MSTTSARPGALITGGTTGIGAATARRLHEDGYAVVVTGQNVETIAAARRSLPGDVTVLRADARTLVSADRISETVAERLGRLDVVFLNAGVGRIAPLGQVDEAFFDEHVEVNVKGQLFTLQRVLPLLSPGSAVIVNSAVGADLGLADWSVYSATKGALSALVPALAVELAPRGIRVNAVSPALVDTPAFEKLGLPPGVSGERRAALPATVPLGRMGTDDEVARTVAFLASPAAAFITGVTVGVDGGLAARI